MDNADTLLRMREHQDRILTILDKAGEAIRGVPDANRATLATARWEMTRRLREYQLFKRCEFFDPLIAAGTHDQRATARRMKADCILLGEDFQAHVARWSGVDIADHWVDYRGAMLAITTRLRDHVLQDDAAIDRMFQSGAARTPALAGPARMRMTARG